MSLVVAVYDNDFGVVVSEGRACLKGADGGYIPALENCFKSSYLPGGAILGGTGDAIISKLREAIEEQAVTHTFAELIHAAVPKLVAEYRAKYPGGEFAVMLLGDYGGSLLCATFNMRESLLIPAGDGIGFSVLGCSGQAHKEAAQAVRSYLATSGSDYLDLGHTRAALTQIITDLAQRHIEINDSLNFKFVIAPGVWQDCARKKEIRDFRLAGADVTATNTSRQASNLDNHTLDNLSDGVSYLRVPATVYGDTGNAVDANGNLKLKNKSKILSSGSTTLSSTFIDLPGLDASSITADMKGNPALIGVTAEFQASTSGGQVTSIGFSPGTCVGNPPDILISISGDGSGAYATVTWSTTNGETFTSILNLQSGGEGYSYATAHVSFQSGGGSYSGDQPGSYSCSVSQPAPVSDVSLSVQVLMDGDVLIDPAQITTDSNGRVKFHDLELFDIAAGTHTFQVQAKYDNSTPATFIDGNFSVIELG